MAQSVSSSHARGPSGAQYLAASTTSRAFSGHVDGSEIFTGVGAWMLLAVIGPDMMIQGFRKQLNFCKLGGVLGARIGQIFSHTLANLELER